MKKELLDFIRKNNLSPFNNYKTQIKIDSGSIYKTKDAKAIHNKIISLISSNFIFADTSNLLSFFDSSQNEAIIESRQSFFKGIIATNPDFLKKISRPRPSWKPKYSIVTVTENDKTFLRLKELSCPVKFLINQYDLESLQDYDIVQVFDCENFSRALESLPQAVFIDSIEDAYLERYIELLSGWKDNLQIINESNHELLKPLSDKLLPLMRFLSTNVTEKLTKEKATAELDKINEKIMAKLKGMTLAGDTLFNMLSKNTIPQELQEVIKFSIKESGLSQDIFNPTIPVTLDELELNKIITVQNAKENTAVAEEIKKESKILRELPAILKKISDALIFVDFISGISKFIKSLESFPEVSRELHVQKSSNLFLEKAQPISFNLTQENRCSILTGANSGGKTTLLEHILQIVSLSQMGLPVSGKSSLPLFSEVYYFAKNKGSANKGAFETLLTQMSEIKPGEQTLILADEIESVTEPGVAGAIVAASADYFVKKGCFLIIATHLGKEIQKSLPNNTRIDGIEAKGLDESFNLIVDHNPVIGRLANSTPELIVEKMANSSKADYFQHLNYFLKNNK